MNRKNYTNEFKLEAVRLAERGDVPVVQVARDMGICETGLYWWIKQFGKSAACRVTPDERGSGRFCRRRGRYWQEGRRSCSCTPPRPDRMIPGPGQLSGSQRRHTHTHTSQASSRAGRTRCTPMGSGLQADGGDRRPSRSHTSSQQCHSRPGWGL